jgi:hypothetical protein
MKKLVSFHFAGLKLLLAAQIPIASFAADNDSSPTISCTRVLRNDFLIEFPLSGEGSGRQPSEYLP